MKKKQLNECRRVRFRTEKEIHVYPKYEEFSVQRNFEISDRDIILDMFEQNQDLIIQEQVAEQEHTYIPEIFHINFQEQQDQHIDMKEESPGLKIHEEAKELIVEEESPILNTIDEAQILNIHTGLTETNANESSHLKISADQPFEAGIALKEEVKEADHPKNDQLPTQCEVEKPKKLKAKKV